MREAGLRDVIFSKISDGGLLVASSEGIAFGDHEGFIAYDNDGIQKSAFLAPLGRLLGLHLTSSYAIALHQEGGEEIALSALYLLGDPEWKERKSYSEGSEIEFFNKGDNSFIAYKEPGDEELQLFGLTPYRYFCKASHAACRLISNCRAREAALTPDCSQVISQAISNKCLAPSF